MLKVDMKKAYDTVEWDYLRQVLICLQFPYEFDDWIFHCISIVSYSILINGHPSAPLPAK